MRSPIDLAKLESFEKVRVFLSFAIAFTEHRHSGGPATRMPAWGTVYDAAGLRELRCFDFDEKMKLQTKTGSPSLFALDWDITSLVRLFRGGGQIRFKKVLSQARPERIGPMIIITETACRQTSRFDHWACPRRSLLDVVISN